MNQIVKEDLQRIYGGLSEAERAKLQGAHVLLTGCAGFLGYYLVNFFAQYKKELGIASLTGLDNFFVGCPQWLRRISEQGGIDLHTFNVITDDIGAVPGAQSATHIYHMASIASPTFYRMYPIETVDANIWGLRRLLDFYCDKNIEGMVFFSSSEIYGDPTPENIPTPETYWGNVSCLGPRACYDEAKRFGETLCYLFHQKYSMPITLIRPFNNYGPGMRLNDKRVVADFARAVMNGEDIVIYSDGSPTRTFCYITDAITGYLKGLLYGGFDAFNIGMDAPEISIRQLAETYVQKAGEILGYKGVARFEVSADSEYLLNNPNRRCPDIKKARAVLGYDPKIDVQEGVSRYLTYLSLSDRSELEW